MSVNPQGAESAIAPTRGYLHADERPCSASERRSGGESVRQPARLDFVNRFVGTLIGRVEPEPIRGVSVQSARSRSVMVLYPSRYAVLARPRSRSATARGEGARTTTTSGLDRMDTTYQAERVEALAPDEVERSRAAGVWLRTFDTKKQFAVGQPARSMTENEARSRRRYAGTPVA